MGGLKKGTFNIFDDKVECPLFGGLALLAGGLGGEFDFGDDGAMVGGVWGDDEVGELGGFADDPGGLGVGRRSAGEDEVDAVVAILGIVEGGYRSPGQATLLYGVGMSRAVGIVEARRLDRLGRGPLDGERAEVGLHGRGGPVAMRRFVEVARDEYR